DAGLGPEEPGERALAFPCRNAPVDVMLVRAADVPEYVQDGVVDCGITGADLVRERGADVEELLALGFGACTLELAVPEESPAPRRGLRARPGGGAAGGGAGGGGRAGPGGGGGAPGARAPAPRGPGRGRPPPPAAAARPPPPPGGGGGGGPGARPRRRAGGGG